MDAARLLLKLIEIERAVGQLSVTEVRSLLVEAEHCAVLLHQDRMEMLNENLRLRGALLTPPPTPMPLMPPPPQQLNLMMPQELC